MLSSTYFFQINELYTTERISVNGSYCFSIYGRGRKVGGREGGKERRSLESQNAKLNLERFLRHLRNHLVEKTVKH